MVTIRVRVIYMAKVVAQGMWFDVATSFLSRAASLLPFLPVNDGKWQRRRDGARDNGDDAKTLN